MIVALAATIGVGLTATAGAAVDPAATDAPSATPTDGFPPNPPTNLTATATSGSVTLSWTAAVFAGAPIVGYDIQYLQAFNDVIWDTTVGNVTTTTITANIQRATQYRFTVRTKDSFGRFSPSTTSVLVVTPFTDTGPDTTPPSAPANLAVGSVTSTGAVLTWSPSTDDVGVTGYNVYQFDGLFVSTLVSTVTGTTATVPLVASPRSYYVRARDAVGNLSAASNTVSTPSPSPSPSPSPQPKTCRVTYTLQSQWPGGFVATITIANIGTSAINGWTLTFAFPGDQKISNFWNASVSQSGAAVTARNLGWNATIPAGGNVSFGFQGTWTAAIASPTAFSVNGAACLVG